MRATLIAGNWKMYKTISDTLSFIKTLLPSLEGIKTRVWIAPPFTALHSAAEASRSSSLKIGGQNLHTQAEGAFTGEISGRMLKEAGASFVLIGHSERRAQFHESASMIRSKVERALEAELSPLLCIGETAEQREQGYTEKILSAQIKEALKDLDAEALHNLVIAYEPVWAIGTGQTATPSLAQEAHLWVRQIVASLLGQEFANKLTLLYGGSVKADNLAALLKEKDIDGALVGGAALQLETFVQLVKLSNL